MQQTYFSFVALKLYKAIRPCESPLSSDSGSTGPTRSSERLSGMNGGDALGMTSILVLV